LPKLKYLKARNENTGGLKNAVGFPEPDWFGAS
jgi:hypothetical protein